jgi:hypothetical protein
MPVFDFTTGTVTAGGFDFVNMTPDQLATLLAQGVPADNLKKLAASVTKDAKAQAQLNKYTATVLKLAMKTIEGGGSIPGLIASLA